MANSVNEKFYAIVKLYIHRIFMAKNGKQGFYLKALVLEKLGLDNQSHSSEINDRLLTACELYHRIYLSNPAIETMIQKIRKEVENV